MIFRRNSKDDFDREVLREIAYLRDVYGAEAVAKGRERAARPRLGSARRKVIEEAVKRLETEKPAG